MQYSVQSVLGYSQWRHHFEDAAAAKRRVEEAEYMWINTDSSTSHPVVYDTKHETWAL